MFETHVPACTAERFFRIDRAQEHLHYLTDIASDALYILDQTVATPDDDAFTSMASAHQSPSSQVGETTPEMRLAVIVRIDYPS